MNNFSYKSNKRKRARHKGRKSNGSFLMLGHDLIRSSEFADLSPYAVKLLLEIASNFNGKNNGDLSAAYSILSKRGWKSSGTLAKTKKELVAKGWLITTRQGGRNRCSLFAVSWLPVDECGNKHDHPTESIPSNLWKNENSSRR